MGRGQVLERIRERHQPQRLVNLVLRGNDLQRRRIDLVRPGLPTAVAVDDDSPGDRHQPGADRAGRPVELTGVLPGTDERFLHHVLGTLTVAGDEAEHVREQRSGVFAVERPHQLLVGDGGGRRGRFTAMSSPVRTVIGHGRILAHPNLPVETL